MSARSAETLAIGSELLGPSRLDTNGLYLSRRLGERGFTVRFRTAVGDDPDDLRSAFDVAIRRSDVVVATGGLGPTVDDLTREAVAGLLGLPLEEDLAVLAGIEARFRSLGLVMPPRNRRQAEVPRGAVVLPNPLGTAPGLLLRHQDRTIALLPGVPAEMRAMVDAALLPLLGTTGERFVDRVLRIAGLGESEVDRRLLDVHRDRGPVEWTILAMVGQIEIHLRQKVEEKAAAPDVERLDAAIAAVLGAHLFGRDDATLESVIGDLLLRRGAKLAVAESLTGGAVARRITGVPGASRYFRGGVVAYSDDAKRDLAAVPEAVLREHGAVSEPAALGMAAGIAARLGADWGLATTGYAGPEGGDTAHPPGTVFLAVAGPGLRRARALTLPGDRSQVQERSTTAALDYLRRALLEAGA
jgi:competence/damage-inducible protein CinA-like protein